MTIEMLSAKERQRLLLSVGTHRGKRPLSPVEVADIFSKILQDGGTLSDCAKACNLEGTTIVSRFLRLLSLPESAKPLVDWGSEAGSISFSSAAEIARLDSEKDEDILVQGALTNRLSGVEVRQVVQLRKRSGRPIKECLDEVVGMRPHIEKRYLYVGAITVPRLKAKLEAMTQNERDELLRTTVHEVLGTTSMQLAKLGPSTFTLVGDAHFGESMNKKRDALEQEINDALLRVA